ncbi:MAG TPA: methyltransferase [Verrucomicrobiae bacterium]|jgi:16S rRNA (guanine1207-N2)-methyltransferase|nr:methyltransferase [Verrucomicrobiae bacterium]
MTTEQLRQDIVFTASLRGRDFSFHSTWGLFSPKAIDEGTLLLLSQLDIDESDNALDLGCGYGPLGLAIANLAPLGQTHMVDKDFVAVEYAAKNALLNGLTNTKSYLSNGFDQVSQDQLFDVIASNVPAKIGSEQLQILLADAHAHLRPGGKLYLVTISGLKDYMKRHLNDKFGNYEKLKQSKTYTAALAVKH